MKRSTTLRTTDACPRRTKIVCTLGPACSDEKTITRMINAGMDVARLNFSHGNYEMHGNILRTLRKAARRAGRVVGVLQDLCGPKIRLGTLPEEGLTVEAGTELHLQPRGQPGRSRNGTVPVEYPHLARDLKAGMRVLFDDGAIQARVISVRKGNVKVRFDGAGLLQSGKGLNLPDTKISSPSVTAKDRKDLEWGLANGVDFVALSFVRRPEDLREVKRRLAREEDPPLLVSKIERPEAVTHLEGIVRASDVLMVARGDLGVEMSLERVPLVQKRLIRMANEQDKPVITATQMLDSMTQNPRPTRAEVSDVTNAIVDGSDAVMLSGETAVGNNPVAAVSTMRRIAIETEHFLLAQGGRFHAALRELEPTSLHDAMALGAERIARSLDVNALVLGTVTGMTARYVASARPNVPVLALTPSRRALSRMTLYWGIESRLCRRWKKPSILIRECERAAFEERLLKPGEMLLVVEGREANGPSAGRIHLHQTQKDKA